MAGEMDLDRRRSVIDGIKSALNDIDNEAEKAWTSGVQALLSQIDPTCSNTYSRIAVFKDVTKDLIMRKADSMKAAALQILRGIDKFEILQVEVKSLILSKFDTGLYVFRWSPFLDCVEDTFKSRGMAFGDEDRQKLNESFHDSFRSKVLRAVHSAREKINRDFSLYPWSVSQSNGLHVEASQAPQPVEQESRQRKHLELDKKLIDYAKRKLKRNSRMSVPDIVRQALRNQEDFVFKPGTKELLKQETIEKRLRRIQKTP
jgi:hypothetical protein